MTIKSITIAGREIGAKSPPYIVAEMSANHNGSLDRAMGTIKMAWQRGADAVKLQTYTAETMTLDCSAKDFQIDSGLWAGSSLYQLYQQAQTPYEWHKPLFDYAKKIGITIFSTPFDETAVDLLEDLNTVAYKIASFEIVDLPLIKYVAQTGKPMIISTGMANREEISEAVQIARDQGCKEIILLHCISGYPTPVEQANLRLIPDLAKQFKLLAGLSDHSLGTSVAVTSVALGACFIEKHVMLDDQEKGPDSSFSLLPEQLAELCIASREAWKSLGAASHDRKPAEQQNAAFRRSIYIVQDIKKGEMLTAQNIRRIRPGFGLPPKYYDLVLGARAIMDLKCGTALQHHMWE
jgi:N-acetylneuraminate synthase